MGRVANSASTAKLKSSTKINRWYQTDKSTNVELDVSQARYLATMLLTCCEDSECQGIIKMTHRNDESDKMTVIRNKK